MKINSYKQITVKLKLKNSPSAFIPVRLNFLHFEKVCLVKELLSGGNTDPPFWSTKKRLNEDSFFQANYLEPKTAKNQVTRCDVLRIKIEIMKWKTVFLE